MIKNNILVVDDDPDILIAINEYLHLLGYDNVHNAGSGREALDILRKENIQITLTDINMPEFNGIELITAMSRIGYKGRLCVISDHELNVLTIAQRIVTASGLNPAEFISKDRLSIESLGEYLGGGVPKLKQSFWQLVISYLSKPKGSSVYSE